METLMQQIETQKHILKEKILNACNEFSQTTGLEVKNVAINTVETYTYCGKMECSEVELTLE